MKTVKFLLSAAFALLATASIAQQNFNDPKYAKWGATPEERQRNILNSNYLAEECKNRNYNAAAYYFNEMITNCPSLQESTYQYGARIYQAKANRAKTKAEKAMYVDSLMLVFDLRAEYFGNKPNKGRSFILDQKARSYMANRPDDRAGIRRLFREAIDVDLLKAAPETVVVYYSNLCEDYKNTDEVTPDEVIAEYERLSPYFDAHPEAAEFKSQFDSAFGLSGAASCENLEKLFRSKLASDPDDEAILSQAVALMTRAKCDSDFYLELAEKYYVIKPSAGAAVSLAQAFQAKGDYAKATKYLNETLSVEVDPDNRYNLLVQLALVGLAGNNLSDAASAARQARELNPEAGVPYFVLANCYAASAGNCPGFNGQAAFWAAYDTMSKAIELLPADSDYLEAAKKSQGAYRSHFPSSEECFFNELQAGDSYRVSCGMAAGIMTTVRPR